MATSRSGDGKVAELPDGPPDASGLTPRQRRVLDVIRQALDDRGYPPSVREIGERVGLTSSSSVAHQLKSLEAKGFLRRDPNRPRALEVLSPHARPEPYVDETGLGDARPARTSVDPAPGPAVSAPSGRTR